MKIIINDHRKIFAIQKEFSEMFPCLKIEFLAKPSNIGGSPVNKEIKYSSKTLGECRLIHNKGTITITPQMTVIGMERNFRDVYGLSVQVFRQSGNAWLETSVTDNWTLEQQNRMGEELSKKKKKKEKRSLSKKSI